MSSCRCLQCGHMKSLYSSIRMGAFGLPMILPLSTSGVAARQGSTAAASSARVLMQFILAITRIQHRPPRICDSGLAREELVEVILEERVAVPHRPGLLLALVRHHHGGRLRDRHGVARVDVLLHL